MWAVKVTLQVKTWNFIGSEYILKFMFMLFKFMWIIISCQTIASLEVNNNFPFMCRWILYQINMRLQKHRKFCFM